MASGGGLLDLVARGKKDTFFTQNPKISFFHSVYTKAGPSTQEIRLTQPRNRPEWGKWTDFDIEFVGDIMRHPVLLIDLPTWLPVTQARQNQTSITTDLSGVQYGYCQDVGALMIEKVQLFMDQYLVHEFWGQWLEWRVSTESQAPVYGSIAGRRTTALCKWVGLDVFRKARLGHVVTAEFSRPNPPGVLPVFCEALGVPVVRYPASTQPAIPGGFVYFDLPGMSIGPSEHNQALRDFFTTEKIEQRILVLNAAYDHNVLRNAHAVGRDLGATHLILTHLDEIPHWGKLWDYLLQGALEPLFFSTGPSLTGDCTEDVYDTLVRRTLAAGSNFNETPEEEQDQLYSGRVAK